MSDARPFEGLFVVDFTHVLAGPACAYQLGLLGAEVVKVESPRGDAMRHRGGTDPRRAAAGMSTAYLTQGAGKRSVSLDLRTSRGRAAMDRLLARADVFIENHRPSTLRELGLHESRTLAAHPRLIHCAMTGYGRGGPLEDAPAYDVNIQATCGLMETTGTAESGPTRTGAPIIDYATALAASFAISAALLGRERTGRGTFVDVSMLETAHVLMSSTITDYLVTGNAPRRRGNLANSRSPGAGSFPCREGTISLGVNEENQFARLAEALDRPLWLRDPRFAEPAARKRNADALQAEIEAALRSRSAAQWETILLEAGVPAAMVRTLPESLHSAQVEARAFLHHEGDVGRPTLPFRLDGATVHAPRGAAPTLGRHDAELEADVPVERSAAP